MQATIELQSVSRRYGAVLAVNEVSVAIQPGEFFSMLGPSGSGKTTCLRLIAGFEHPTSGKVMLDGKDMTRTAPYDRDVNTVFQDYALFPHLTVQQNVEYGLRMRGVAKSERASLAREALEQVDLSGFDARKTSQLSGGQRQRVALARALVNRPSVLLLDEPLGALDLRLREQMQIELKKLHKQLGITFIYVTHDQGEAMSMSDRIAVFANGKIEQVDTPRMLYQRPATSFVADFVGGANVLRGDLAKACGAVTALAAIRPEQIHVAPVGAA
ncbi:MAG: ABC transporter ATP-binding protein, partial [Burkholderiales bacterium]